MEATENTMIEAIDEAKELINEAIGNLNAAYDNLRQAQRKLKGVETGYNMTSNMDVYVLNYISGGASGSLVEKCEKYVSDLEELGNYDAYADEDYEGDIDASDNTDTIKPEY